ncbi:psbP-like protein 1, chloroplastic isoform X2 [Cornus florida]|uniref:psbP-like protein 1, chloroplastic isoform X2 n=1 Tax=Cornus florida TaxID=4283 RepID=UPI0028A08CDE|nr:psbP-like protein 1, chloroplastic isoform X2 [Cornus florida]XP_059642186.1 psbP-like protein 1, chloroplastic isoform X2 [Cornus florida]
MVSLQNTSIHQTWLPNASTQLGLCRPSRRGISFLVRAEQAPAASTFHRQDRPGRRQLLAVGATIAPWILMPYQSSNSFAAETKKGFLSVTDKKDGYSFVYPFGWQEVVIEGQDKVFKDVIEPLENVSVNLFPTTKQDIRDLGSPQEVAETLIKKVLAPPSQKTMLIEAAEHDVDGRAYYTIEFVARAPNYTRHALSAICIGNGKFYTVSTGANERRWEKMKDKLHTVIDSFQIFNV